MAETLLTLVHAALTRIHEEASQASENRDKLQELAGQAQIVRPLLAKLEHNLAGPEALNALSRLHQCLQDVADVMASRGRRRGLARLPLDAIMGRASKVQAEIAGAKERLLNTVQYVSMALQGLGRH